MVEAGCEHGCTQPEKKCNNATTRVVIGRNEGFQSETEVQQALKVKQI